MRRGRVLGNNDSYNRNPDDSRDDCHNSGDSFFAHWICVYRLDSPNEPPPPVKLPKLDPPVTGERAVPSDVEKACPPDVRTPAVFAFLLTSVAIIATPTIASKTVVTEAIKESDMFYIPPKIDPVGGAAGVLLIPPTLGGVKVGSSGNVNPPGNVGGVAKIEPTLFEPIMLGTKEPKFDVELFGCTDCVLASADVN